MSSLAQILHFRSFNGISSHAILWPMSQTQNDIPIQLGQVLKLLNNSCQYIF